MFIYSFFLFAAAAIVALSAIETAKADLPIHALTSDVVGTWRFFISKEEKDEPVACGGGTPNMNKENLDTSVEEYYASLATKKKEKEINIIRLVLTDKKARKINKKKKRKWRFLIIYLPNTNLQIGTWTMVYDEGFEMRIGKKRFFGIIKYSKTGGEECRKIMNGDSEDVFGHTKCYKTDPSRLQLGWVVQEIKDKKGLLRFKYNCFYGEKEEEEKKKKKESFVITGHDYKLSILPPPLPPSSPYNKNNNNKNIFMNISSYELNKYKNHHGYQKIHYSLPLFTQYDVTTNDEKPYACEMPLMLHAESAAPPLPTEWTWGDPFLSPNYNAEEDEVLNQKNCGSCYALSSVYVIQKRIKIFINKKYPLIKEKDILFSPLSPQSIISCSPYNQGCDGGYPYLVGKEGREIGITTTECFSYMATHNPLYAPCLMHVGNFLRSPAVSAKGCGPDDRWYVEDYYYVGGFYEGCNEEKIMQEIYANGPVVAAIDAPDALFVYEDGFFDTQPTIHGKLCDTPHTGMTGWEYTNHAIAIVGWGEDPPRMPGMPPRKFWVVRNTWGNEWGRNGYIKIKRGENFAAIESQVVAIDPDYTRGRAPLLLQQIEQHQQQQQQQQQIKQQEQQIEQQQQEMQEML